MYDTPLRLVLFDFDGTLCDSAATIIRLMKQACAACDLPVPEDSFIRGNIGHGVSHAALTYADGNPEKASQLADTYRMIARDEYLGGQPPLDPLFDGAAEVLRTLQSQGYLTGIITNKSRTGLDSLITRHGLDKLVDVTISADDCAVQPRIWRCWRCGKPVWIRPTRFWPGIPKLMWAVRRMRALPLSGCPGGITARTG